MFSFKTSTRVKFIRADKRKIVFRTFNRLEWGKVETEQNFSGMELVYKINEALEKDLPGGLLKLRNAKLLDINIV